LRDYLKRLPDFDDVEAERQAIAHAAAFPDALTALLLIGPRMMQPPPWCMRGSVNSMAAIMKTLGKAAEHRADKWPAAATLLYRAMVLSVLERGFSKGYKYAARDLENAASVAGRLPTDSSIPDHDAFVAGLKAKHGRKYGFWTLTTGTERVAR
jgi:hypothetical protein